METPVGIRTVCPGAIVTSSVTAAHRSMPADPSVAYEGSGMSVTSVETREMRTVSKECTQVVRKWWVNIAKHGGKWKHGTIELQ